MVITTMGWATGCENDTLDRFIGMATVQVDREDIVIDSNLTSMNTNDLEEYKPYAAWLGHDEANYAMRGV